MTATEVLARARQEGIDLSATPDGKLRWRSRRQLSDGLRELLVRHKAAILRLLISDVNVNETPPNTAESGGSVDVDGVASGEGEDVEAEAIARALGLPPGSIELWEPHKCDYWCHCRGGGGGSGAASGGPRRRRG